MNPETLERLLIDRALGQLPPDVEALLSEHLASDSASARVAHELHEVVELAGRAVRRPLAAVALPPLLATTVHHRSRQILALAASFVVGGIATLMAVKFMPVDSHTTASIQSTKAVPQASLSGRPPAEIESVTRKLPFWSNRRAYLLATNSAQAKSEIQPR